MMGNTLKQGGRETALDIYKKGYSNTSIWPKKPDSKEFFFTLRGAVAEDFERTGACGLADELLREIKDTQEGIDIIVYAVFADIANGMPTYENSSTVPNVSGPSGEVKWEEFGELNSKRMNIEDSLQAIHSVRQKYASDRRESRPQPETGQPSENNSDRIIQEAQEKAKKIIDDANLEADRIRENAKKSAEKEFERVKEEASQKADSLTEQYIRREQAQYRSTLNEEMQALSDAYLEKTRKAETLHREMCEATDELQAKWIEALDQAKGEFYDHLHRWQVGLYPKDIKPLANVYIEAYRILNVDKLIPNEILAADGRASEETIKGLQKLDRALSIFLRRFEKALNGLDLYVYTPKAGDTFDEEWHAAEDEEQDCEGHKITECVIPGIAKKFENREDDVIIPAIVRTDTSGDQL